jgi:predicted O-linked N-acetylglucosamine transferase (SPINDLY family)
VTFGSFNSAPKINRGVVAAWARILKEVPGSGLLLKALEFQDAPMREEMLKRFEAEGVEPGRVEIVAQTASFAEHLALYERVDVGLDPFPYNGTTTTFEALWMGVPVVSLTGETHAGRVGNEHPDERGLDGLIARSVDEYVERAVGLAGDNAGRAEMRASLRERVKGSALCDGEAYGKRVSEAIVGMWREWCGA